MNSRKKYVVLCVLIAIVTIGIMFFKLFSVFDKDVVIKTSYGDTFIVSFDSFRIKSGIMDENGSFHFVVNDKIERDDLVELYHSGNTRVYKIKHILFWNDGNGFQKFDGNLSNNTVITSIVKSNLLLDYSFFSHNIDFFWNNNIYHDEMVTVVKKICSGNYAELSEYGLTEDVINDSNEMEMIRTKAKEYN